jgi:hypothetical protein
MWAIASGIEGNLAAYEAVVADLKKSRQEVENFYLLGDIIGPTAVMYSTYSYQSLREIWTRMLQYAEYPPQAIADFLATQGRDAAVLPPHEVAAIVESSRFDRSVLFMQTLLIHAWYARRS